jgi:hypothetical protein
MSKGSLYWKSEREPIEGEVTREDGFYWVRRSDEWQVARWDRNACYRASWSLPGSDDWWDDAEMIEIDERRIVRMESYEKSGPLMDFLNTEPAERIVNSK